MVINSRYLYREKDAIWAKGIEFEERRIVLQNNRRCYGYSIRPVISKGNPEKDKNLVSRVHITRVIDGEPKISDFIEYPGLIFANIDLNQEDWINECKISKCYDNIQLSDGNSNIVICDLNKDCYPLQTNFKGTVNASFYNGILNNYSLRFDHPDIGVKDKVKLKAGLELAKEMVSKIESTYNVTMKMNKPEGKSYYWEKIIIDNKEIIVNCEVNYVMVYIHPIRK